MKVIDKRGEIESKRVSLNEKLREMKAEKQRKEQEKREKIIWFISDWIVEDVYVRASSDQVIFNEVITQVQDYNRGKFFEYALNNRGSIDTIIIKDHEPMGHGHDKIISIESDMETIDRLHQEARKLNLEYEEYIRGIYYTTAVNMINSRERAALETAERIKRTMPVDVTLTITQDIREKLESKFGQPQYSRGIINYKIYDYGDMLLDLANEYFRIEK